MSVTQDYKTVTFTHEQWRTNLDAAYRNIEFIREAISDALFRPHARAKWEERYEVARAHMLWLESM